MRRKLLSCHNKTSDCKQPPLPSLALQTFTLTAKVSSPDAYAIPIQVRQKNVKSVFISRSPVQKRTNLSEGFLIKPRKFNARKEEWISVDGGGNTLRWTNRCLFFIQHSEDRAERQRKWDGAQKRVFSRFVPRMHKELNGIYNDFLFLCSCPERMHTRPSSS